MKRHVSFRSMVAFLCLSAMLLTAPAIAAEAETDAPVVPTVSTTTPNGTAYAWQPGGFYFQAGADRIFMDYFCYELSAPLRTVGKTSCITLSDLEKIYAPDFTVTTAESGAITISHAGRTVDAKSILNLMTLALPLDSVFTLRVDGGDEQAAFEAIKDLFANRFGESE